MTTNAIFKGTDLPKWVKRFSAARDAREYAESCITEIHQRTTFHIACDPVHGDDYFYLIVKLESKSTYQHFCKLGFFPMEPA